MTDIIYSVNDSLFDAKSPEELKEKLLEYYTVDGYTPEVTIDGDIVHVHIDGDKIEGDRREFEWIAELCGRGRFGEAIPKLDALLRKHPRHSEAYRLKAQLLQQEGKIDEAIDVCIDALRCNPRNIWALMVMGNLFNQGKNDADTAEGYYKKVLEYFPDSAFAINNVASVYAQRGETEKAIPLYKRVIELEPDFENPYYGLAKISYDKGDYKAAFDMALEGCLKGVPRKENPQITGVLRQLMADCAERIIKGTNFENIFLGIKDIIETEYHADIRLEADDTLQVYAQMQYGPTRGRRWHLLKYNPKLAFREHLMVHELMHLDMMLEDKKKGLGAKIVHTSGENEMNFRTTYAQWYKKLINKIGHSKATEASNQVLSGLILQLMNCPLDLFVEQRMYDKYPSMRPMHLLSLLRQEEENVKGTIVNANHSAVIPLPILRANKIMNLVTSLHFKHLYGIDTSSQYKPSKQEMEVANELYDEYKAYFDMTPGEEFDLILFFAETFDMEGFFTLSPESDFYFDRKEEQDVQDMIRDSVIGDNPTNEGNTFDGLDDKQKELQDKFYEQNKDGEDAGKTFMMAMYMVNALEYFDNKPKSEIQRVAMDIAFMGAKGIDPDKKHYHVNSIDGSDFSGYQLLAYYYVSFKLFNPSLLKALALPFDAAWEQAETLWNKKKGK